MNAACDTETRDARNWGAEPWRQPELQAGDIEIFSEHGRIAFNVDYRSHWFKLVKAQYGGYFLLVKHGGGEERHRLHYGKPAFVETLAPLPSDLRYLALHTYLSVIHDTQRATAEKVAGDYRRAFVEGRLKKRKRPGQDSYKVWLENSQEKNQ